MGGYHRLFKTLVSSRMMIEAYLSSSIAYNDLAKLRFNAVWVLLQVFMEQLKGAY